MDKARAQAGKSKQPPESESASSDPAPVADGRAAKSDTVAVRSHDPTRLYLSEIGVSPLLTADEASWMADMLIQGGLSQEGKQ